MNLSPPHYIEPVFRPPSEARSLILQITNGCSWNQCTFCEMYTAPQKKFSPKKEGEIIEEIKQASEYYQDNIQRVFLADGDAMVLSTNKLLKILDAIKSYLPSVRRVGSYCLPGNVKNKNEDELKELRDAGLKILYIGAESGDDEVLKRINKNETYSTTVDSLIKIKKAGITTSVMILNGLGGTVLSGQHAMNSAKLVNNSQPDFLSTLVLTFPGGENRFVSRFRDFQKLNKIELFKEMRLFLEKTELERTVFRSDHASNYLVLKGTLGRDKDMLVQKIDQAIITPGKAGLRDEWERGL